jgi:hypothetical protein
MSQLSATTSVRSAVGVDEFDDFIQTMKAHSLKERSTRTLAKLSTKSIDEFDDFISFLRTPTPAQYQLPKSRSEEEYEAFVTILATPTGLSNASMLLPPSSEQEENDVLAFATFLKGGPLPPRAASKSSGSSSSTRYPSVIPIDYISKETKKLQADKEAARLAKWEAEADVAILYFTKMAMANKNSITKGNYGDDLPIAMQHFADAAHRAKNNIGTNGNVEEMPIAFQHFSLPAYEKVRADRAKLEYERLNPPPMPIAMEYFTQPSRDAKAKYRAEIQALIDNPPPQPIAMQHFSAVEATKKLEVQEYEPEIAMRHFAALAAAEKARRASSSLQTLDETPIAMQHFADLDAKKKEAKSMNASSKLSTIVVPDPVPIDYFNQLYAAERKAKLAESRSDNEVDVPIAIRHFTNTPNSDSTTSERSGGNVPYEEMLAAYKHFNPPKTTKEDGEVKTENLPIAIQRFTMAAYEEKQRLKAIAGSGGDGEGPSVAHLHFTPGLSLKQIVTAE